MKKAFLSFLILGMVLSSCKSKKPVTETTATKQEVAAIKGNTIGRVSHQYRSTGCATVVIVNSTEEGSLTLIPKDKLPENLDIDGTILLFDYHTLKMPQPAGCNVGIPAELSNISKK